VSKVQEMEPVANRTNQNLPDVTIFPYVDKWTCGHVIG
jgi:hypothetical protein